MRAAETLEDVQVILKQLVDFKDELTSRHVDMRKRRVVNAGPSVDPFDYVIKDEVNALVNAAIQELDFNELLKGLSISGGGGSVGLTNPLEESILASLDSQFDIGARNPGNRIRWGFADVWNAVTFEVENAANTAFWEIELNAINDNIFEIRDKTGVIMQSIFVDAVVANHEVQFKGSLRPLSGALFNLGTAVNFWGDLYLSGDIGTSGVVRPDNIWVDNVIAYDSIVAHTKIDPDADLGATLGSASLRFTSLHVSSIETNLIEPSTAFSGSVGGVGNTFGSIRSTLLIAGDASDRTGEVQFFNASSTDVQVISSEVISTDLKINIDSDFIPTSDNTKELGLSSRRWSDIWGVDLDITGTLEGGALIKAVDATTADCQSVVGGNSTVLRGSSTAALNGVYVNGTQVVSEQGATISDPTGGGTQDAEARTAINAIIDRLQAHGLIA